MIAISALLLAAPLVQTPEAALLDGRRRPDASIDLATREGCALVRGSWRYHDAQAVPVDFRSAGPDKKPSGPPNRTLGIEPAAGGLEFDDSGWELLDPTRLDERRSSGRVSFGWYRIAVELPERVGDLDVEGTTVVFETVVDDYAEVWVDGELPRELGQSGGSLIRGWNAPNRLVVARDARPGTRVQIAVFGINGPLSDPPANYVWMRSARLELFREPRAVPPRPVATEIVRLDPALDAVVGPQAVIEKVAEGFHFTEGPVWHEGALVFSDPNVNRMYRWSPSDGLAVFREESGYSGEDVAVYRQPGSNGLGVDAEGRLVACEHGNRRVTRLEPDGGVTVLADRFGGRRLNSPNDLVLRSDGALFFTDPPFGLPAFHDDVRREVPFFGVYCVRNGEVELVAAETTGPNGLVFSPDERWLYVANWDDHAKVVRRYEVDASGRARAGRVFADFGDVEGEEALDGIEVDALGNVLVSGPGGLWVLDAEGRRLGVIRGPELAANMAWGGDDGLTLYLTARTGLYRLRTGTGSPAAVRRTTAF